MSLVAALTLANLASASHPTLANRTTFLMQTSAATDAGAAQPGTPFSADKLAALLPSTVYFQGRSAPLQIRNAGGTTFAGGQVVWAALVDTSGYSTSVQERYQFDLVGEGPLRLGDASLPAGAYGAGFVGDRFLVMDLGGHTLVEGALQMDASLRRPRPLQVVADQPSSVKLYLGRHWVALQAGTAAK